MDCISLLMLCNSKLLHSKKVCFKTAEKILMLSRKK